MSEISSEHEQRDVVILGGGLAGLTLAIQLIQRFPQLKIAVIERRAHPVPHAAHKVGESSVEIGAHYFEHVLGLKEHLMQHQLKKFGFRFFFNDGQHDITQVTELGASTFLPTPSYQLDRGIFENALAKIAQDKGVQFVDGALVREFTVSDGSTPHAVSYERDGIKHTLRPKWLIDASGRVGLIKKRLKLEASNEHDANAVWFRMSERIDVNGWTKDDASGMQWIKRCDPPNRWLSTNHLVGEGYWVWLIPLASGSHSVGIVADAKLHPIDTMNSFEKAMQWFATHQPQLHEVLNGMRDKLQDFAFFKRFSYGCKQVFNGQQRWALTGEAGLFLDPFYSPGSDFIAISNTYITELIAQDLQQGPVEMLAGIYEQIYFSLYENMLSLYTGQYKLFGDPEVMPVKVIWDYTYYWGVMCQLFFQNRLTEVGTMGRMQKELATAQQLNKLMQRFMREWNEVSLRRNPSQMLDQAILPWFRELNRGLRDVLDDKGFNARMKQTLLQLEVLAAQIVLHAREDYPMLQGDEVMQLLSNAAIDKAKASESMLFAKAA